MGRKYLIPASLLVTVIASWSTSFAQGNMPEILTNGTVREQFDYINERTRIYENYRAIREDMFQQLRSNIYDSLDYSSEMAANRETSIRELTLKVEEANSRVGSVQEELDMAIRNRDTVLLLGISVHKILYNTILWSVIAGLLFLTGVMFLMMKRALSVTRSARTDLEDIKREFEDFRRVAHENKEKLILSHFNEIKKLKARGL